MKVKLNYGEKEYTMDIPAHKTRSVSEIIKRIVAWFKKEVCPKGQNADDVKPGNFQIIYKSRTCKPEQRLVECDIDKDCELEVKCDLQPPKLEVRPKSNGITKAKAPIP